jgi:hypothetical protein
LFLEGVQIFQNTVLAGNLGYGTIISFNGTGAALYYHPTGAFNPGFTAIENLSISGGNNSAAQGIEIADTYGFRIENVGISGFSAGEGLILHNINYWTEGVVLQNCRIGNNLRNLIFRRSATNTWPSFGYIRALNCSINANTGQTGILLGDDLTNAGQTVLYNGIMNINVWLSGSGTWIQFGSNAVIQDTVGTMGGECDSTYTGTGWPPNTATAGLFSPSLFVRSSPLNPAENQYSMTGGTRYYRTRDLGAQRPGQDSTVQWFKLAVINPTKGLFTGQCHVQGQYGQSSFKSAVVTFAFGVNGNGTGGFVPALHVVGDAFTADETVGWSGRFAMAKDSSGNYNVYFRRPSYANVCVFNYAFDWTTGLTYDLFTPANDPLTDGTVTVVYDSFNNAAQGVYSGDEQIFTGQRWIFNTNGSTTLYTIPHNLGAIPGWYCAFAMNAVATAAGIQSVTADNTNVYIRMNTATAAGTGNVQFAIEVSRNSYWKPGRT